MPCFSSFPPSSEFIQSLEFEFDASHKKAIPTALVIPSILTIIRTYAYHPSHKINLLKLFNESDSREENKTHLFKNLINPHGQQNGGCIKLQQSSLGYTRDVHFLLSATFSLHQAPS